MSGSLLAVKLKRNGQVVLIFALSSEFHLACVAGVERGRGRGNLGARESVFKVSFRRVREPRTL